MMKSCKNCTNSFEGQYCNQCGEKVLSNKDFKVGSIIKDAISAITNLDGKIFRSLKTLFFRPGKLSKDFVNGVRIPYLKPFQLFLVANLLFFIFLSDIDIFRSPSKWYFIEDFDGVFVLNKVRQVANATGYSITELRIIYDASSTNWAKSLLFLYIPALGLVSWLLHFRLLLPLGKHFILSLHFFTYFLFYCLLAVPLLDLFPNNVSHILFLILVLYCILSFRRFYRESWFHAIWKAIALNLAFILFINLYRSGISWMSLQLLG